MKKLLSMMLALLMLALPVFGCAGAAVETSADCPALSGSLTAKYTEAGQEIIQDIRLTPGDALLAMMGLDEKTTAGIRDLMNILGIRVRSQRAGQEVQMGLDVQLNGQTVTGITAAVNPEAVYVLSNILGEDIYTVTMDELEKAAGEEGAKAVTSLKSLLSATPQDQAGAMAQVLGSLDGEKLTAMMNKLVANTEIVEIKEAPARMPDAKQQTRIILKKEDLREAAKELARLAWSAPGLKEALSSVGMTEEARLSEQLTALVDKLQEDVTVNLFMNEKKNLLILAETSLVGAEGAEASPLTADILYAAEESGYKLDGSVTGKTGDVSNRLGFLINTDGKGVSIKADLTDEDQEGAWQKLALTADITKSGTEGSRSMAEKASLTVLSERGGQPMVILLNTNVDEQDLGDHAEGRLSLTVGLEGIGDLLTVNCDMHTAMAEAYIISGDAVRLMQKSQEEMEAWTEGIQNNAMMVLVTAMQQLPESVMNLLNGGSSAE